MIVFVQPAGLSSPGGGPRILRALLREAPLPFLSVCTSPAPPPRTEVGAETHLPSRRRYGRLESTRFARWLGLAELAGHTAFEGRLEDLCRKRPVAAMHALAHGLDFWPAFRVAKKLNLPYFLSVHDDLGYALRNRPERAYGLIRIRAAWTGATGRFVISQEMGEEYCRRYGRLPYALVTDGLESINSQPLPRPGNSLRVYFMGLFHHSYGENLRGLRRALSSLRDRRPDLTVSLTCRCGSLAREFESGGFPITVLPLATEADVARDMEQADLLYLPMPFGKEYADFSRYSLSTKLITYLGSGLPILYHGPAGTAAGNLLAQHGAAVLLDSRLPEAIAEVLSDVPRRADAVTRNALTLGTTRFQLSDQRERFWQALCGEKAVAGHPVKVGAS